MTHQWMYSNNCIIEDSFSRILFHPLLRTSPWFI